MMNALNLLFHRSTIPLSTLSHCPTDVIQQTLVPSPDSLIPFHSIPTQTSSLRFLVVFQNFAFRQLSVRIPSKQTSSTTSVSSTLPLLAYLASKPTCDVAGFSDYSLLETAICSRCCPKNRAICSDVWKRHLLAPATRHTNTKYQGRRQQETHTPTAKTVYRNHDPSPTARHRIRNEKREREIRESSTIHHPTSCQLFPEPIRQFRSIPIYPTQLSSPEGSLVHV